MIRERCRGSKNQIIPMKKIILLLTVLLLAFAVEIQAAERLENYTNKTVLVFTPHPDDDTFAVGVTNLND